MRERGWKEMVLVESNWLVNGREERALQATGTQVSYQQMVETEMKHEVTIIEREWMERDSIETNRLVYDVGREERGY